MREITVKKWRDLAPFYQEIHSVITPFQSYEFLTLTGKGKPYRKDLFRLIGLRELNLLLYRDGRLIAIAPLLVKKKNGKRMVYMRGHFTSANDLDFAFNPGFSYDDFKFLMDYICGMVPDASFYFDRVSGKSQTSEYLKQYLASGNVDQFECVAVPIPCEYDEWFKGLKKSVRQNMVTYRNRMKRDGVDCKTQFFCKQPMDAATCKKIMQVYADRFIFKNNFRFGFLLKPALLTLRFLLMQDKMTRFLMDNKSSFHAILYMNGDVAAFLCGVICPDGRIIVSRLAISTRFSKYSPGGVLIDSVVRYISEENRSQNLQITELDLSMGGSGGMSYKYTYGGVTYYNYHFY